MTEQELIDWVLRIEKAQRELAAQQEVIIAAWAELKPVMLQALEGIALSNRLLDEANAIDLMADSRTKPC